MNKMYNFSPYAENELTAVDVCRISSAVYFVFAGEELLYIGQTTNLKRRVREHKARFEEEAVLIDEPLMEDVYFKALPVPEDLLDEVEKYYIEKYLPPYNCDYIPQDIVEAQKSVRLAKMELAYAVSELETRRRRYMMARL